VLKSPGTVTQIRLIANEDGHVTFTGTPNITSMHPALHNRPGQRLPLGPLSPCHIPRSPLLSPTFSTTTTVFSLVTYSPKTSPFAAVVASSGPMAKTNPFRFSTKWWDDETGLGWWGYRWLQDERWISRDPIGEKGLFSYHREEIVTEEERNLYGYVNNSSVNAYDVYGLYCGSGWNEWLVPDNPGGFPFGPSCQTHDGCYGDEGCKAGKTRHECDQQFLEDMQSVCSSQPEKVWGWCSRPGKENRGHRYRCWKYPRRDCESWALLYHSAVSKYGQGPFDGARKSCCSPKDDVP